MDISVIVPVGGRAADPVELYAEYRAGLEALGRSYEIIFVLDGPREKFAAGLKRLACRRRTDSRSSSLTRRFGEATALMAGFEQASGQVIVTLPAYHQIEAAELPKLVAALERLRPRHRATLAARRRRVRAPAPWCLPRPPGLRHGPAIPRPRLRRPRLRSPRARGNPALRRPAPLPAGAGRPPGLPGPRSRRPAVAAGPPRGPLRAAGLRARIPRHLHGLLPGALHQEAAALLRHDRRDACSRSAPCS